MLRKIGMRFQKKRINVRMPHLSLKTEHLYLESHVHLSTINFWKIRKKNPETNEKEIKGGKGFFNNGLSAKLIGNGFIYISIAL